MFLTTLIIVCSITTESFFERIIIYSVTDVFVWAMLNFQFDMKKFFAVFQDSSRDIIYLESSGRQAPIWTHWSILVRSLRLLQKTLIYIQVGSCTQADNPVRNCLFRVNSMYKQPFISVLWNSGSEKCWKMSRKKTTIELLWKYRP